MVGLAWGCAQPMAGAPGGERGDGRPSAERVQLSLDSTPRGALVWAGSRELGVTPLSTSIAWRPGDASLGLRFSRAGYEATTLNARPADGLISLTAPLTPRSEVSPGPPDLRVRGRGGGRIRDHGIVRARAHVSRACTIARLEVELKGRHGYYGDLYVVLEGPEAQRYSLSKGGRANPFKTHPVTRARGKPARGRWRLSITDQADGDGGRLRGFSLRLWCR